MKRGELSMEVIIIAAIALLVLVILSVLVLRQGGGVASGSGCEGIGKGAMCDPSGDCPAGYGRSFNSCKNSGEVCCIPIDAEE